MSGDRADRGGVLLLIGVAAVLWMGAGAAVGGVSGAVGVGGGVSTAGVVGVSLPQVRAFEAKIKNLRSTFANPSLPPAKRRAALEEAAKQLRARIEAGGRDLEQPIWETNLAELLLADSLAGVHDQAMAFGQFGVLSEGQKRALEREAAAALALTGQAQKTLFELRRRLASGGGKAAGLTRSLRVRLLRDYAARRTPFFHAWAAVATALLGDDSPYFAAAAKAAGGGGAGAARRRLLHEAIEELKPFIDGAQPSGPRIDAMVLTGRALLIEGRAKAAMGWFEQVLNQASPGWATLLARLGKARALAELGADKRALGVLKTAAGAREVRGHALRELLVVDAEHRLLLGQAKRAAAGQRAQAVARAYEPYSALLAERSLGAQAKALGRYVELRWANHLAGQPPGALPAAVRLGVGRIERMRGQNEAIDAKHQKDAALRRSAVVKLKAAARYLETLKGSAVDPAIRAPAMFNLAIARYWLAPKDWGNLLAVGKLLVATAQQMPDEPVADRAIGNGVALLRQMEQLRPGAVGGVEAAYRHGAEVLFKQFPLNAAADNERLYFGEHVLEAAGQWAAAVTMYRKVPLDHRDYFDAQRRVLVCLEKMLNAGSEKDGRLGVTRQGLVEAARAVQRRAATALKAAGVSRQRATAARHAEAEATFVLADMAGASGDVEGALDLLAGFAKRFSADKALTEKVWRKRIGLLVAAHRLDEAAGQAKRMIAVYPKDGARMVDAMFTQMMEKVEVLKKQARGQVGADRRIALLGEASDRARTAMGLAKVLLGWAERRGLSKAKRLPYELMVVRSLRLADEPAAAVKRVGPLIAAFPDDEQVIANEADALFAVGDHDSLIKAAQAYDRLIEGLGPPYPGLWWHAWVRRLQINDRLGRHTGDIVLRIRQLERAHRDLGGPPYRQALLALKKRYEQRQGGRRGAAKPRR